MNIISIISQRHIQLFNDPRAGPDPPGRAAASRAACNQAQGPP